MYKTAGVTHKADGFVCTRLFVGNVTHFSIPRSLSVSFLCLFVILLERDEAVLFLGSSGGEREGN